MNFIFEATDFTVSGEYTNQFDKLNIKVGDIKLPCYSGIFGAIKYKEINFYVNLSQLSEHIKIINRFTPHKCENLCINIVNDISKSEYIIINYDVQKILKNILSNVHSDRYDNLTIISNIKLSDAQIPELKDIVNSYKNASAKFSGVNI